MTLLELARATEGFAWIKRPFRSSLRRDRRPATREIEQLRDADVETVDRFMAAKCDCINCEYRLIAESLAPSPLAAGRPQ